MTIPTLPEPDVWSWRDWLADVFWSVAHYGTSLVSQIVRAPIARNRNTP